jgi:hypothetical protein
MMTLALVLTAAVQRLVTGTEIVILWFGANTGDSSM